MSATVNIDFPNSSQDGSGFIHEYSNDIYLITARHNLLEKNISTGNYELKHEIGSINFNLNYKDSILTERKLSFNFEKAFAQNLIYYSSDKLIDVVAVKFGNSIPRKEDITKKEIHYLYFVSHIYKDNELGGNLETITEHSLAKPESIIEGNRTFLFGFQNHLGMLSLPQYEVKRPLLRSGIVAGINHQTNRYIIDATSFKGNSGGPVLQIYDNRLQVIGIVIERIPLSPDGEYIKDSGYSVVQPIHNLSKLLNLN